MVAVSTVQFMVIFETSAPITASSAVKSVFNFSICASEIQVKLLFQIETFNCVSVIAGPSVTGGSGSGSGSVEPSYR